MAMIPGSYAHAAGLQSEINKVTVTRVAGSEVQFRRTIDTYQRDLRYNVGQIGREQRQLRRSMRRYSKKLHDSKKERQQRLAKAKEDSARLKHRAHQFREAEQAVKSRVSASLISQTSKEGQDDQQQKVKNSDEDQHQQQRSLVSTLPDSPDSGIGGDELEDSSATAPCDTSQRDGQTNEKRKLQVQKAFLTSTKGKVPYFKAKRGQSNKRENEKRIHKLTNDSDVDQTSFNQSNQAELLLPVINEENEDGVEQLKSASANSLSNTNREVKQETTNSADDSSSHGQNFQTATVTTRSMPVPCESLDTKSLVKTRGYNTANRSAENGDNDADQQGKGTESGSNTVTHRRRKSRRKTDVSYGDLIKLKHNPTSSTKQLFKLVDRLASRHGIVGPFPVARLSKASSLDPRDNIKIKQRGDGPESQISDGMVKQAAVLYPMKYGYNLPDNESSEDATQLALPPPHFPDDPNWTEKAEREDIEKDRQIGKKDSIESALDGASRKLSSQLSRRDSLDVFTPLYESDDAASTVFDDTVSDSVPHPDSLQQRRVSRSKSRQLPTLAQLSDQVSKIRKRSFQTSKASHHLISSVDDSADYTNAMLTHDHRESRPVRKLSPLPRRSRSLSRRRRDSVEDQLQRRLQEDEESGHNMAWQSAFGRLKILHTLYDLSRYFDKNS